MGSRVLSVGPPERCQSGPGAVSVEPRSVVTATPDRCQCSPQALSVGASGPHPESHVLLEVLHVLGRPGRTPPTKKRGRARKRGAKGCGPDALKRGKKRVKRTIWGCGRDAPTDNARGPPERPTVSASGPDCPTDNSPGARLTTIWGPTDNVPGAQLTTIWGPTHRNRCH